MSLDAYEQRFAPGGDAAAIGEASPFCLHSALAPAAIHEHVPDAKLIAMLRHPVERAYSHWRVFVVQGHEPSSKCFQKAVADTEARLGAGWCPAWDYVGIGRYHEQLSRYYHLFPAENIRVYLTEDLANDPLRVCKEVFELIGVDPGFVPELEVHGAARRSGWLFRALRDTDRATARLARLFGWRISAQIVKRLRQLNTARPKEARDLRSFGLGPQLRHEIMNLQELLGRDLKAWLDDM